MRSGLLLVTTSLVAALAACGGESHKYPSEAIDYFMVECTAQPNATESYCRCALDELQKRLSYDEFKRVDTAIVLGQQLSGSTGDKVIDAVAACR